MSVWVTGRKVKPRRRHSHYGHAHQQERKRLASQPKVCGICGYAIRPGEPWDLDHVLPISLGGGNGPTRPTHSACNRSAGAKLGLILAQARRS